MNDDNKIQITERSIIWQGRLQRVELLRTMRSGIEFETVVMHGLDGAVIFALNDLDEVAFVEVYRVAVDDILIELPAGKIESGEQPLDGAMRELQEETGLTASSWQSMGMAYGSQGASSWKCFYFMATDLVCGPQSLAPHENHRLIWLPRNQVWSKVESGQIRDNFSICGIAKGLAKLKS